METRGNRPVPGTGPGRAELAGCAAPAASAERAAPAAPGRTPEGNLAGLRIRPFRDGDEDAVVALREACGLVRPWNDPRRDVDRARGAGTSEIFVAIAASGGGERIVGSVMAGFDGHRGWVTTSRPRPAAAPKASGRGRCAVRRPGSRGSARPRRCS